jgi:hypothetical protein
MDWQMNVLLKGITGLCASRKGIAFLITSLVSGVALMTGHLPGPDYAKVIMVIFGVFTVSHAYQQANAPSQDGSGPPHV